MSTTDARTRRLVWWGTMLGGLAVILVLAAVTAAGGERDTAAGILTGGLLALGLAVVARVRSVRRGLQAATASRVVGGEPDERDRLVYQRAAAAVGVSAFVAAPVAMVANLFGADAETLLGALPWVFIGVGVVAFVVIDRRS
jgi:ABC-type Mn2+/Zn2+ transport system permease subunit